MNPDLRKVEPFEDRRSGVELRVGIDLGTSQSSISAAGGGRAVVASFVGWPVDSIAERLVGRDPLVGVEALEKRSMLDLHRPLEHGVIKRGSPREVEAIRAIVRRLLVEVGAEEASSVQAVLGVPAEALRVNRQELRQALAGIVDRLMIVSEPFAVGYGEEALLHSLVVDLGAGTTDLCVLQGRLPTERDQRTLSIAGDSIDRHLLEAIQARYPEASLSIHTVRRWKEEHGFVGDDSAAVIVEAPIEGRPTKLDIGREMRAACGALVPPVVETMTELVARVEPDFQERVRQNVILAGCTSRIRGLAAEIERRLLELGGGRVRVVDDPVFAGSDGGLAIALDAPESDWHRLPKVVHG